MNLHPLFGLLLIVACMPLHAEARVPSVQGEIGAPCVASEPLDCPPHTVCNAYPDEEWEWAESPEELGWSSEKLARAMDYAGRIGTATLMIVEDGIVVDAWGETGRNYRCHSMRKSLLSALYGIYVDEGVIDLSDTLEDLDIDDKTPLTSVEKQATVADLLTAQSGVYIPAAGEVQSMIDERPERGSHLPGTFWYYNNWDFNALGTIFDQETGLSNIFAAFQDRVADPIGMQDFDPVLLYYRRERCSIHPYYGFEMSTRDLARFGLLFLREGRWNDQQIISTDWIHESTASQVEISPDRGYGYMWWNGESDDFLPNVTIAEHSYYAWGHRGHFVVVLPYRDLVIVHRVDTYNDTDNVSRAEFGGLVWQILDAAGETGIGEPPFIDLAPGLQLSEDELLSLIPGSTLRGMDAGLEITVINHPDGDFSLYIEEALAHKGTWRIEGSAYCVDVPGADIGGSFSVVLDDNDVRLFEPDGALSIALSVVEEEH